MVYRIRRWLFFVVIRRIRSIRGGCDGGFVSLEEGLMELGFRFLRKLCVIVLLLFFVFF